jgi:diketogulonate reductase-like aldo/keto reductase
MELHPWLQQKEFVEFHKKHDIVITQYSPFGNLNEAYSSNMGKMIDEPVLVEIGKKYGKTGAHVALGKFFFISPRCGPANWQATPVSVRSVRVC